MRLNTSLSTILGATLLATLTACGSGADADPFTLIQEGNYAAAVAAIKPQLATVEQGSSEHKELLLAYTEALAVDSPGKAKDEFIAAFDKNKNFLVPKDLVYIANRMAGEKHLVEAIAVMDKGKKTWPSDEGLSVLLEELKVAASSSGDEDAKSALKGLGYLGD